MLANEPGPRRSATKKPLPSSAENEVFEVLQKAAAAGQRCPTNPQIAEHLKHRELRSSSIAIASILKSLTRQGKIIVRVYGKNWRDVKICAGPFSGKTTMAPSHGGKPHLIFDSGGRRMIPRTK